MGDHKDFQIEADDDLIAELEHQLSAKGITSNRVSAASISGSGFDLALIVEIVKTAAPVFSGVIGYVAARHFNRSIKIDGIEIRGFSVAEIEKLLTRIGFRNEG